jgi:hypothetical protein
MRAGASLEVWNYSTLAEDLASHGYVVVGIDAPYRAFVVAFPDGRVIRRLPENNPELCIGRAGEEQARCVNRLLTAWTSDIGYVLANCGALSKILKRALGGPGWRQGKKVMQFLEQRRYVAVVVDGKVQFYGHAALEEFSPGV